MVIPRFVVLPAPRSFMSDQSERNPKTAKKTVLNRGDIGRPALHSIGVRTHGGRKSSLLGRARGLRGSIVAAALAFGNASISIEPCSERSVIHGHALLSIEARSPVMPPIAIGPQLAEVAQLIGDPGRANILSTLMDGRALTAGELAAVAHVTPQTASSHLAKLVNRELLSVTREGRHRYYKLGTPLIAR